MDLERVFGINRDIIKLIYIKDERLNRTITFYIEVSLLTF